jgi:hypothetical protein
MHLQWCDAFHPTNKFIALVHAISERLIPGISYTLRIGSLQQISVDDHETNISEPFSQLSVEGDQQQDLSSLDYVVHNDASRDDTLREFKGKLESTCLFDDL